MSAENISEQLDQVIPDITETVPSQAKEVITPATHLDEQILNEVSSRSKENSDSDLVSSENANR
ncbi:hypothetical protein [Streptococcus ovuberis]|uniref:Uncharacterized protein n=1 Tax=Streptococcus ovuberis TaxID=1936207 RepID=A0A7X6S1T3_9STRE|nr:hypothetical protein [Streptococcus ovuberis]NKZ20690.1 hypothetical protein [Streptococcus ovuberis]